MKAPATENPLRKRLLWSVAAFLAIVTVLAFQSVVRNDFIIYDDPDYVTANPMVQAGLTIRGIAWAFTSQAASNWHPMTWLSHMLDCQIFGLNPAWHHFTSMLLHVFNTLLLFYLLYRLTAAIWRSAFVALLFAIHPLHVESVAWISERKDVLSGFFFLLTLLAYTRYAEASNIHRANPTDRKRSARIFYVASLLLFALGLMAKPMLVTVPFVLLLLDCWPLARVRGSLTEGQAPQAALKLAAMTSIPRQAGTGSGPTLLRLLIEKIPFFVLAALSSWITLVAQSHGKAIVSGTKYPLLDRFLNAPVSYGWYLMKLFSPVNLSMPYPLQVSQPEGLAISAMLFLVAVTALVFRQRSSRPWLLAGWLWFTGMLVPVAGFVQVGSQAYGDRYTYLPYIGLFIVLTWSVSDLTSRWRHRRFTLVTASGAAALLCFVLTTRQVRFWKSNESLFGHAVTLDQKNTVAWWALGVHWANLGQWDKAVDCYSRTQQSGLSFHEIQENLGFAYLAQKKYAEAETTFRSALASRPDDAKLHGQLALALNGSGQFQEAIREYQTALRLDPNDVTMDYKLADSLFEQEQYGDAILCYRRTFELRPDLSGEHADARARLAQALAVEGRIEEARTEFETIIRLRPDDAAARLGLAMALESSGNSREAAAKYRETLEQEPDSVTALNNLAWLLATDPDPALRNGDEAVRLAEHCCSVTRHDQAVFIGTLAAAYAEAGRFPEAIQTGIKARDLAEATGHSDIASSNAELLEMYRANKPFHRTFAAKENPNQGK